jgi:hypothetical protein
MSHPAFDLADLWKTPGPPAASTAPSPQPFDLASLDSAPSTTRVAEEPEPFDTFATRERIGREQRELDAPPPDPRAAMRARAVLHPELRAPIAPADVTAAPAAARERYRPGLLERAGEQVGGAVRHPIRTLASIPEAVATSATHAVLSPGIGESRPDPRLSKGGAPSTMGDPDLARALATPYDVEHGAIDERERTFAGAQTVANLAAGKIAGAVGGQLMKWGAGQAFANAFGAGTAGATAMALYGHEDPLASALAGFGIGAGIPVVTHGAGRAVDRLTDVSGGMVEAGARGVEATSRLERMRMRDAMQRTGLEEAPTDLSDVLPPAETPKATDELQHGPPAGQSERRSQPRPTSIEQAQMEREIRDGATALGWNPDEEVQHYRDRLVGKGPEPKKPGPGETFDAWLAALHGETESPTPTAATVETSGPAYVRGPSGSPDLHIIPDERVAAAGWKGGPVRATPDDLTHIEERHLAELQQFGYGSAAEFVQDVLGNYDAVYKGAGEGASIFLARRNGHARLIVAELRPSEEGSWRIRTARVMGAERLAKTRELLWEAPRNDSGDPGSSADLTSPPHPPGGEPGSQSPTGTRETGPQQPSPGGVESGGAAARPDSDLPSPQSQPPATPPESKVTQGPSARTESGRLRSNLSGVSTEDLATELLRSYDANAQENTAPTINERESGVASSGMYVGMKGAAVNAAGRVAARAKTIARIEAELERRGVDTSAELVNAAERHGERMAEQEGMRGDYPAGGEEITDETGKVLFSPAGRGPGEGAPSGPDLFGEEAPPRPETAQTSMFGGREGTEESRGLKQVEAASRSEVEKLREQVRLETDPTKRQRAAQRLASLERFVNRDRAITADELSTRATAGEPFDLASLEEGPAGPDQSALFSPAGPGTPVGKLVATAQGIPPAEQAAQAARVRTLAQISRQLAKAIDVPLRQGRFGAGMRSARGAFFPHSEVARLLRYDHLDTAAHEIGHYVSKHYLRNPTMRGGAARGAPALPRPAIRELVQMGKDLYGSRKPAGGYGEEGLAQWARFYVTDPARLAHDAPTFSTWADANMLTQEPALKAALDQARNDFADHQAAPYTARIDAMIDVSPRRRSMPDTRTLATTMLDDLNEVRLAVDELGTKASADKDAYTLSRLTRGGAGTAEEMIERGVVDPKTGQRATKGFAEILAQLKPEDVQPFRRYLVAERTLEVAGRGIDTGIKLIDAHQAARDLAPKYEPLAREVWKISDALIDYREAKGLLTPQEAAQIKAKNQRRVGFFRVFDESETAGRSGWGRGFGRNSAGLQRMRGSARQVIDPLESVITDIYRTVHQAHAAEVLSALVDHAEATEGGGRVIEVLTEEPKRRVTIPIERVKGQIAEMMADLGIDVPDSMMIDEIPGVLTSFEALTQPGPREAKDLVRPLVMNGERRWIQIKDAPLFDALAGLGTPQIPAWARLLGVPTRVLRAGATLTAEFLSRNPVKDAWTAAIYSRAGERPPGFNFSRGLFHVLRQDKLYQDWRLAGGDNAAMLGIDRVDVRKHIIDLMRSSAKSPAGMIMDPRAYRVAYRDAYEQAMRNGASRAAATARATASASITARGWVLRPIDTLRMVSSLTENATRVGEFAGVRKRALKAGASPEAARAEGALAARDVTIDFARAGTISRQVNQIMAFFNAGTQGFDKLARELRDRPQVVLPRIAAYITIPSIALYLAQRDDPAYQEVPAWQKVMAWVIVDRDRAGNLKHIWRIPKPPELGILFGSIPERILDWIHTRDPHALDAAWDGIQNLDPVHVPEGFSPLLEWWANKTFFTGRPIVPEGIEKLPPGEQSTSRTGEVARLVGGATNLSPAKIENTVRSGAGGLGQYGMDIANQIIRSTRRLAGAPPLPRPQQRAEDRAADAPLLRGFMVRIPQLDAQSVQDALDAFNRGEAFRQAWHRRLEAGDRAGAVAYFKEHEADIRAVAVATDRLGGQGVLRQAHDLIIDAQRVSRDADEATRRRVADQAIVAARNAMKGLAPAREDRRELRRGVGQTKRPPQRPSAPGTQQQ